jgi:hypothetical protein
MVVNFRARGINWGTRKLTRTPMLIIKKNINWEISNCKINLSLLQTQIEQKASDWNWFPARAISRCSVVVSARYWNLNLAWVSFRSKRAKPINFYISLWNSRSVLYILVIICLDYLIGFCIFLLFVKEFGPLLGSSLENLSWVLGNGKFTIKSSK